MTAADLVTVFGSILIAFVAVFTFVISLKANRAQALSAATAVDAAAYARAKDIYEAALNTMRIELEAVRADLREARADIRGLRESNDALRLELVKVRSQLN
jgi:5-bromo-4-chloroindolyl phosphate hydrolysis protein